VAIIESASTDEQRTRTTDLSDLSAMVAIDPVSSPALLVIGEVVSLRSQLPTIIAAAQRQQLTTFYVGNSAQ
jgi:uroporphyrin-III C-methyltransferase